VGRVNVERPQNLRRIVRHHFRGYRTLRHHRATCPAVVERDQTVAIGEPVELELPRLHSVSGAADEQHIWASAQLIGPDL
jgi:hypothetical protein